MGKGMGDGVRYRPDPERSGMGLGLAPLIAAAPAAGPAAPIVAAVGIIGSIFAGLFGGGGDKKTDYRPPANSANQGVQVGNNLVAFDMNNLALANARGNETVDLFSYYSAFVCNCTDQANKRSAQVLLDSIRMYGYPSIRAVAEDLLTRAGVPKRVEPIAPQQAGFLPSQTGQKPTPSTLDSIIANILKNIGTIFTPRPAQPTQQPGQAPTQQPGATPPIAGGGVPPSLQQQLLQQAINAAATIGQALAQQLLAKKMQVAAQAAAAGCDPGAQYYDPYTNSCVFLLPCPQDQYFEPLVGQCMSLGSTGQDFQSFLNSLGNIGGIPVWLLALVALALAASNGGDDGSVVRFRTRRRRR